MKNALEDATEAIVTVRLGSVDDFGRIVSDLVMSMPFVIEGMVHGLRRLENLQVVHTVVEGQRVALVRERELNLVDG